MITDENDPRFQAVAQVLVSDLQQFIIGQPLDAPTLNALGELVRRAQSISKSEYGVDFPKLVALVIPRHRRVHLYRADLEAPAIAVRIKLLAREYPDLTPQELADMVRRAWPSYRPHQVGLEVEGGSHA